MISISSLFILGGRFAALATASLVVGQLVAAEQVELQFVSIPKEGNPVPVELQVGEEQTIEVELPTNRLSQTYTVPKLAEWVLGRSSTNADGETVFTPLGSVAAAEGSRQLILVIRRDAKGGGGYDLVAAPNIGGGGTFLFFNASGYNITGQLDIERFGIEPGQHALVKPAASAVSDKRRTCDVRLKYAKPGEEAAPFFSGRWRLNQRADSIAILHQDPLHDKLRLHTIRRYVP